jgi:hypothetical protein
MNNSFPFLGSFVDYLPIKQINEYAKSVPKDKWVDKCSPLDFHTYKNRPIHEQDHNKHYGIHNAVFKELIVSDKNFFPNIWFDKIKAKTEGYVAKIYYTTPGNFEPPHMDFFPSFLTKTKPDGTMWTQEDINKQGKKIIRAWIPLMDSKLGHLLYGENHALSSWKAGDVYELPSGETHGFANGGREDRYVMVFTSWRA